MGSATELFRGTEGPHRLIEISVSPGRDHVRQHDRRLATDPEIEEAAHALEDLRSRAEHLLAPHHRVS